MRIAAIVCMLCAMLCAPCFGQAWSGILSTTRAIDWTTGTGLPATITYGSGGSPCNGSLANCVETVTNPWTPPTRVQCGSTVSAGATPATINADIAACSPGSYVLLGAGSFTINANLVLRTNGVTLRGSGGSSTVLNTSAGAVIQFGVCCGTSHGLISGTPAAGSSTVTLTGATGNPSVNQLADINQCDPGWSGSGLNGSNVNCNVGSYSDPGTIWPCGIDYPVCSNNNSPSGSQNWQHQMVHITAVSGTCSSSCTVTFTPALEMGNWGTTSNAQMIWQSPSNESIGVGLEDLTVSFTFQGSDQIKTQSSYAWWVKGVRLIGDGQNQRMDIGDHSVQGLFANNYIFAENSNNLLNGISSEPLLRAQDTGTMLLNNIITGGLCLWGIGGMVGEVVAYNYCRDSQSPDNQALMLNHDPTESLALFEGNQAPQIHGDNTHGTNNLNTLFRNYSSGYDSPFITTHARSFFMGNYNRFYNYIGNSLGGILTTTYSSTGGNDNGVEYVFQADALTAAGFMRWGNCDVVTATCRFQTSEVPNSTNMPSGTYPNATSFQNSVPGSTNLPCSFFMSGLAFTTSPCSIKAGGGTGLSWWKVCTNWSTFPTSCSSTQTQPFPPVGPDQSGGTYVNGTAYDNPAAVAYKYLPIDTSLQNSLTITASTWSNVAGTCQIVGGAGGILTGVAPCEILTVSFASIDNGSAEHIMGGFQLSGVNSACIPAGISFATLYGNNEILMTGSTTTKVAYSLPSDPGANACTGTLLFPNIRKFDERVFQNDPLSGVLTYSPNPLSFNPQPLNTTSSGSTITITNTGGGTVTLTSEALQTGTNFAISSNTCGGSLGASASCVVTITFTPLSANSLSDNLVVTSSDTGSPVSIPISGIGLATPVISPVTGSYSGSQTTTITDATTGVSIYYTLNGSAPTNASTLYSGSFVVSTTTTVKAIAYLSGVASGINTSVITITGTNNNLTTTVNHVVITHAVVD